MLVWVLGSIEARFSPAARLDLSAAPTTGDAGAAHRPARPSVLAQPGRRRAMGRRGAGPPVGARIGVAAAQNAGVQQPHRVTAAVGSRRLDLDSDAVDAERAAAREEADEAGFGYHRENPLFERDMPLLADDVIAHLRPVQPPPDYAAR